MIAVITSVRNGEKYIEEAIDSVLKQTFQDWEYYIVDNGSQDRTSNILKEHANQNSKIKYLHQPEKGLSKSINFALKHMNTKYVTFLDYDDLFDSSKLEKQFNLMEQNPEIDFCFSMLKEFSDDNLSNNKFTPRKEILNGISKSTLLFRREVIKEIGVFDENVIAGDFIEWYSRAIRLKKKSYTIPEVLAYRRVHDNNMTASINRDDYLKTLKLHLDAKRKAKE